MGGGTSKRDRRSSLVSDRFVITGGAKSQSRSSTDDVWGLLRLCRVRGRNRPLLGSFQSDGVLATNRRAPPHRCTPCNRARRHGGGLGVRVRNRRSKSYEESG